MILLDTNVIRELMRPAPSASVVAFLRRQPSEALFTVAICVAEIRDGLARMPAGRRQRDLAERVDALLTAALEDRILPFSGACAVAYGGIRARRVATGRPIAVADALIAATAQTFGARLATRDVEDFAGCAVEVVDPWQPA